jgi:hypothetical protein
MWQHDTAVHSGLSERGNQSSAAYYLAYIDPFVYLVGLHKITVGRVVSHVKLKQYSLSKWANNHKFLYNVPVVAAYTRTFSLACVM